jgi:DNA-binding transcriptional ArsR family regulator
MPILDQNILDLPTQETISVRLEPVHNAMYSLTLVAKSRQVSGFHEWITHTAESMSEEEWRRHELVMIGLHYAVVPEKSWSSFPAYLDHLAAIKPTTLREKLMDAYANIDACEVGPIADPPIDRQSALENVENYLSFLRQHFDESYIDVDLETRAYAYITQPAKMQALIVSHLHEIWERYLAEEWERVKPMLQDSVRAFNAIDFGSMSKLEAAQFITGQDLEASKWEEILSAATQIVFVPNAHNGPYLGHFKIKDASGIFFGARLPKGTQMEAPDLSRNELLVRLTALADDSRLRIMKLVADQGEMRSQEIIQGLDLSQSAASRHLMQLSASGYLNERRCEGAKCYTLSNERLEETLAALSNYLQPGRSFD